MPYKDKEKQKKAQSESYERNKPEIISRMIARSHRVWAQKSLHKHKKEFSVNLTTDELEILAKESLTCKYCNRKLDYTYGTKGKPIPQSPSLDRINNEKEININNVQIICRECNTTKGYKPHKEFIEYCSMIHNKFLMEVPSSIGLRMPDFESGGVSSILTGTIRAL